jgi:CYTH domain-containing protein
MDIERKWLFDGSVIIPYDVPYIKRGKYNQAYLSIYPEVRIWNQEDGGKISYKLCIKGKGTIERIEIERDLTKEEFEQLMDVGGLKEEDFIKKIIYVYDVNGHILVINFTDIDRENTGFIYGEIEFLSVEKANAFIPPSWFGKEVTNDPDYKMANYWQRTRFHYDVCKNCNVLCFYEDSGEKFKCPTVILNNVWKGKLK